VTLEEQLIDTWTIHNRINLYLLDTVADEALGERLGTKGRTVYQLFAKPNRAFFVWAVVKNTGG
jgi:hypothetical protein